MEKTPANTHPSSPSLDVASRPLASESEDDSELDTTPAALLLEMGTSAKSWKVVQTANRVNHKQYSAYG